MRKTINISMSEAMYDYVIEQCRYGSVSEYFRSLVVQEQQRRADNAKRPEAPPRKANDVFVTAEALDLIDRLRSILNGDDR